MRIVFLGCVEMSHTLLERLLTVPEAEVVGVVTRRRSPVNSDFRSLEPLARAHKIPCLIAEGNRQAPLETWMSALAPDVAYCFGWSYLLKPEVLEVPRLGVVGFHPAALPRNRGRHPIIWALALGLRKTASSFFFMDAEADSGDILHQLPVDIGPDDDAAALYARLTETALQQLPAFTRALATGDSRRVPQDHSQATSWRKRSKADGFIDWRMSARTIHNLVRALARPYPGAHCMMDGAEARIWKVEVLAAEGLDHIEPGQVLESGAGGVVVKCGEGAVRIVEHELPRLPEPRSYL